MMESAEVTVSYPTQSVNLLSFWKFMSVALDAYRKFENLKIEKVATEHAQTSIYVALSA